MSNYDANYATDSDWLKAKDWPAGTSAVLTIASHEGVNFAKEGEDPAVKCCLKFEGKDKGIVLNNQNYGRLKDAYGDDCDEWIGKEIKVETEKLMSGQFAGNYMFVIRGMSETAEASDIPF
jgi:hypothetical protein